MIEFYGMFSVYREDKTVVLSRKVDHIDEFCAF